MTTHNCYTCLHREDLAGDAHSQCSEGLKQCLSGLPKSEVTIRVSLDPHGVRNGWAMWPFNFDPIWITTCNSHTVVNNKTETA
jgi:hypothetical protein